MRNFRFLEWKVYKDAKVLFAFLLRIVKDLPREFRFEMGSQLTQEGNNFVSEKEFDTVLSMVDSISRQLGGFKKRLVKSNFKSS